MGIAASLSTAARPSEWRQAKVRLGHSRVVFFCNCSIASAAPPPFLNIMCNMGTSTASSGDQPGLPSSPKSCFHCRHVPKPVSTCLGSNAAPKMEMSSIPKAQSRYFAHSLCLHLAATGGYDSCDGRNKHLLRTQWMHRMGGWHSSKKQP